MNELREIVYMANGSIEHSKSIRSIDPSGARDNHGDRPTADALCCYALARKAPVVAQEVNHSPEGSMIARREIFEARKFKVKQW